jgi:hypothetical protein
MVSKILVSGYEGNCELFVDLINSASLLNKESGSWYFATDFCYRSRYRYQYLSKKK